MTRSLPSSCAFAALLLASTSLAQPPSEEVQLDTLLAAFAKMDGLEARFVEEKRMQLLRAPLRNEGRLYFAPPGYLLRRIDKPQPSKVLITPESLTIEDGASQEVIDLRARSDVRSFVGSFVSLLAGDKKALTAAYRITLASGEGKRWRMELAPKASPLSDIIRKVQVIGRGLAVTEIHVFDTNGDQTITRLLDVNPRRQFDASERESLFGIRAP